MAEILDWCKPHWLALREAVKSRGMERLISKGGEAAARQAADELRVGNARDSEGFDPLLRAWGMINSQGLKMGMGLVECPLCFVQRHHDACKQPNCAKPLPEDWISGVTDSLRAYAVELKLIEALP